MASVFLPRRLRPALETIYAFARFSDDLADEPLGDLAGDELRAARRERLLHWRGLLDDLPVAATAHPILFALREDAHQHGLPLEECRRLLDAFLADQEPPDYPDSAAVLAYCRDSAAPVGRLLLALNKIRPDSSLWKRLAPLSDEVCAGLQLANFWQDFSRDLPAGRLYIPRDALARHSLPASTDALPGADPAALQALLGELLDWADTLLGAAGPLAKRLPWRFALEVRMFAGGGLAITARSRSLGAKLLSERPQVDGRAKTWIALGALFGGAAPLRRQSAILRP